jgi:HSP20 family protein
MFIVQTARASHPFAHLLGHTLEQLFSAQNSAQNSAKNSAQNSAQNSAHPTAPVAATEPARTPTLDLVESAAAYTATLELPGVQKADVQVQVEGKRVTVKTQVATATPASDRVAAEPAPEPAPQPATQPATQPTQTAADFESQPLINYRERVTSRFARSFNLPQEVNAQDVQAKLENGVLTLTLPKRVPHQAAQVTVN